VRKRGERMPLRCAALRLCVLTCGLLPAVACAQSVLFERASGDEFFYSLRKGDDAQLSVAPGDRLVFTGAGVVKGLVPPFRPAAQEENGAWSVAPESRPGRVVFVASAQASVAQDVEEGFVLLGRMGVSAPGNAVPKAVVRYEYVGDNLNRSGEVPGPAEK
jgi:hypothetical protein